MAGVVVNRPGGIAAKPTQSPVGTGPAAQPAPQAPEPPKPPPPPAPPQASTNTVGSPSTGQVPPPYTPQAAQSTQWNPMSTGPDGEQLERDTMGNIVKVNGAAPTQAYWDKQGQRASAKAMGFDSWEAYQASLAKQNETSLTPPQAPSPVQPPAPPPAPSPTTGMSALGGMVMPQDNAAGWDAGASGSSLSVGLGQRSAQQPMSAAMSALRGKLY